MGLDNEGITFRTIYLAWERTTEISFLLGLLQFRNYVDLQAWG